VIKPCDAWEGLASCDLTLKRIPPHCLSLEEYYERYILCLEIVLCSFKGRRKYEDEIKGEIRK